MKLTSMLRSALLHRRRVTPRTRLAFERLEDRSVPAKLFVVTPGALLDATHFADYRDAYAASISGDTIQMQPGTAIHSIGPRREAVRTLGGQAGSTQMTVANYFGKAGELVTIAEFGGPEEIRLIERATTVATNRTLLTFNQPLTFDHSGAAATFVTTNGAIGVAKTVTIQGYAGALAPITSQIKVMSGTTGVTFRFVNYSPPDELLLDAGSHYTSVLNSVVTDVKSQLGTASQGNVVDGNVITNQVVMNNWENGRVTNNTFLHFQPSFALEAVFATGVLIQGNTFKGTGTNTSGIRVVSSQGIQILNNSISIPNGDLNTWGIEVLVPATLNDGRATELVIQNNVIETGATGIGIHAQKLPNSPSLTMSVSGTDFHNNFYGIELWGDGQSAGAINQGFPLNPATPGANNFRSYTAATTALGRFAIFLHGTASFYSVPAQNNTWSVDDPNTVIRDGVHNAVGGAGGGTIDVGATQLSPDQRFVQALLQQFLGRAPEALELNNWIAQLPRRGRGWVVTQIARSPEAFGRVVDEFYWKYLGHAPDALSRSRWIRSLQWGASAEQLIINLLSSAEYLNRVKGSFGDTDTSFVQSVYRDLRGRYATDAEVAAGIGALRWGRANFVAATVRSAEFRQRTVRHYFATLYHRTADVTPDEVESWTRRQLGILAIRIGLASQLYFYENG